MTDKLKWLENAINTLKGNSADEWITVSLVTEISALDLDSLDVVELQMMYEEDFKCVTADPDDLILTAEDLIKLMP